MDNKKKFLTALGLGIAAFLWPLSGCTILPAQPTPGMGTKSIDTMPTAFPFQDEDVIAIDAALQESVRKHEEVLAFLIYHVVIDNVKFSESRDLALVWFALYDPEIGEVIPIEPSLAIARQIFDETSDQMTWQITLQSDSDWSYVIEQIPLDLLSEEMKERYMPKVQSVPHAHQVFSGYRLPWENGHAKRVSGSIGHVFIYKSCPTTCLYAFDFADGSMFPVLAAKGGTVKYAVWKWPNGNTEHTNYLVLKDTNTNPTTYQVYYHLAQDSIPPELRYVGAEVVQGQFIGHVDDTGASTGHHLHFHVHTNPNGVWGTSVDITFDDVAINGGRPRTCYEASHFPDYGSQCQSGNFFVSGNSDYRPPTGNITDPVKDQVITSPTLIVQGDAEDDTGVSFIQVMYTYDGDWHPIGNLLMTTPFATEIDLCQAGIPNGTFFLSLQIMDQSGKRSEGFPGLTPLVKDYQCSPPSPVCSANNNQVAIYSEAEFQGNCTVLDIGEYSTPDHFGDVCNDDLESIQIGSDVIAFLFPENSFSGQQELLLEDDNDLSDNDIGANQVSSIKVEDRPDKPSPPLLDVPRTDQDLTPTEKDQITLTWIDDGSSDEFRSELSGQNGFFRTLDWQQETSWPVGTLPSGEYNWIVWGRNITGQSQATLDFTVETADHPSISELDPLPEMIESTAIQISWVISEGEDDLDHFEIQYQDNDSPWQDWARPLPSHWRQAWFLGEMAHTYKFRLRSVDFRGNKEPYPSQAEATVKIAAVCAEDEFELNDNSGDDLWSMAIPLEVNRDQEHNFCPLGDEDWIVFPAKTELVYQINTTPLGGGAAAIIQLYGFDRYTLLGEQKPDDLESPAKLDWIAPQDGLYYLRLRPLDAGLAGTEARYNVRVDQITEVDPSNIFCGSALIPILWFVYKVYQSLKEKRGAE